MASAGSRHRRGYRPGRARQPPIIEQRCRALHAAAIRRPRLSRHLKCFEKHWLIRIREDGMNKTPPFHADHVGSLLRPHALIEARHKVREGTMAENELRAVEDRAIREVVRFQEDIGLPAVTDGEFRRGAFFSHFVKTVEGMTVKATPFTFSNDAGDTAQAYAPYTAGRLKRSRGITTEEFKFVHSLTSRTAKVTLPAPPYVNFLGGRERVDPAAYAHMAEYFSDLAAVYREEFADLADLGCSFVQLDEVPLAMMEDARVNDRIRSLGEDPDALIDAYIDVLSAAVANKPANLTIGMHLCRGNYRGRWLAAGGYGRVADRIFNIPGIDVFFMEYDSPRAGDFSPLASLPTGKMVVLGLISSKTAELEDKAALLRRIDEAAKFAPLDQLGLSPQCGFATNLTGSPLTLEDERTKLRLVVDVAGEVWKQ
jgi:5-methyltetrahydropteroyltriglutamate--homocysteine methyltransferase